MMFLFRLEKDNKAKGNNIPEFKLIMYKPEDNELLRETLKYEKSKFTIHCGKMTINFQSIEEIKRLQNALNFAMKG